MKKERWQSLQRGKGTIYGQQLRGSSASVLPFRSDTSYFRAYRGEKSYLRPCSGIKFYLQRDEDGEVHHQLDRLYHLKKESFAILKLLMIKITSGASTIIRECESENECVTSMSRKEACDRRQDGWRCLVLAREGTASTTRSRARSSSRRGSERMPFCSGHMQTVCV